VGDRKPPALRLARKRDAFKLALRVRGIEDDQIVAVARTGIEADDRLGLKPSLRFYLFFKLQQNGTVLFFHQAQIIALGGGLQLPLILEERGLVEIGKDFVEFVILEDARAPKRRF